MDINLICGVTFSILKEPNTFAPMLNFGSFLGACGNLLTLDREDIGDLGS